MTEPRPAPAILGIELGGTKLVAVMVRGGNIVDRRVVPTTGPDETCDGLRDAMHAWQGQGKIAAIGIASFGPVRGDAGAGGYLPHVAPGSVGTYIMPPALGVDAGPLGAIALGETALKRNLLPDQQGRAQ